MNHSAGIILGRILGYYRANAGKQAANGLLLTVVLLAGLLNAACAEDCRDVHDPQYVGVLGFVEMKRQLPHLFEQLVPKMITGTSPFTSVVQFGVDDNKQPVNIRVVTTSGEELIDLAAMDAVKAGAPYREKGACFQVPLSYTPPRTVPGEETGTILKADTTVRDQVYRLAGGNDTYYFPNAQHGQDIIDDESGEVDVLRFGKNTFQQAIFQAVDSNDADNNIDGLYINFGSGNSMTIYHYFANNSTSAKASLPGPGLIERIQFGMDAPLGFKDVQALLKEGDVGRAVVYPQLTNLRSVRASDIRSSQRTGPTFITPASRAVIPSSPTLPTPADSQVNWENSVIQKAQYAWSPPSNVADKLLFQMQIEPSGALKDLKLLQGSGDPLLDEVALKKVRSLIPFTPPPNGQAATLQFKLKHIPNASSAKPGARSGTVPQNISGPSVRTPQLSNPGGVGGSDTSLDWGPYMAEIQRRIKRNWAPPQADRSKRVVTFFTIARDGRLLSVTIQQSAGSAVADEAALAAIRVSAPFPPLPASKSDKTIDVQFIFDYNVFSGGGAGPIR